MEPDICDLANLSRATLLGLWHELKGSPPPKGLSRTFLIRVIAHALQIRRGGGLPKPFRRQLAQAARKGAAPTAAPALRPGSRLLREWNGETHVIDVVDAGFLWKGSRYRSLSAIAREITGAHWSGPRFFRLAGGPGA